MALISYGSAAPAGAPEVISMPASTATAIMRIDTGDMGGSSLGGNGPTWRFVRDFLCELRVIAFVHVRVGFGKGEQRTIEDVARSHVSGDCSCVARARMRSRE